MARDDYEQLPDLEKGASRSDEDVQKKRRQRRYALGIAIGLAVVLLVAIAAFFLWPRSPSMEVNGVEFKGIKLDTKDSSLVLDLKLAVRAAVRNPNYFAIKYDRVRAYIDYRSDELGRVDSAGDGGRLPSRGSANVTALLNLDGLEIVSDAPQLIADAARDRLPLTTRVFFQGNVILWFLRPRVKASAECKLVVNPSNGTVLESDCDLVNLSTTTIEATSLVSFSVPTKFKPTVWYMIVLYVVVGLALLAILVRILWPLPPDVDLEALELLGINADTKFVENSVIPDVILDVNVRTVFKVRNRNFFGATYDSVRVYVYYYEYELAKGEFLGGHVRPRETSSVDGAINIKSIEVAWNAGQLLSDYTSGRLPLSITVEFNGNVGMLYCFKPPVKCDLQYNVVVDPSSGQVLEQSPKLK